MTAMFAFRPWGYYEVLHEGENYKVKKLVIHPYKKLSLQSHRRRTEYWTVISGFGIFTIGEKTPYEAIAGGHARIMPNVKHRIENNKNVDLVILELQIGDCQEEDITRYEDEYGRCAPAS